MNVRQPATMSAERFRITIQVDEQIDSTLRRLAAVQGRGVSAIVREMLEEFEPGLRQVAELGEAFERASAEQRKVIAAGVERADKEIAEPLAQLLGRIQEGMKVPALSVIEGGADPRPVTTGVKRKRNAETTRGNR